MTVYGSLTGFTMLYTHRPCFASLVGFSWQSLWPYPVVLPVHLGATQPLGTGDESNVARDDLSFPGGIGCRYSYGSTPLYRRGRRPACAFRWNFPQDFPTIFPVSPGRRVTTCAAVSTAGGAVLMTDQQRSLRPGRNTVAPRLLHAAFGSREIFKFLELFDEVVDGSHDHVDAAVSAHALAKFNLAAGEVPAGCLAFDAKKTPTGQDAQDVSRSDVAVPDKPARAVAPLRP